MRKKYSDCTRSDSNCAACSLSSYGIDCHGNKITAVEWHRHAAGLTQKQLAEKIGVHIRYIQKLESGERSTASLHADTFFLLADALGVEPRELLK